MKFKNNLAELFKSNWNNATKVVQKDNDFMFRKTVTEVVDIDDLKYLYINCSDWVKVNDDYYEQDVINNETFAYSFNELCKRVIDKDFIMFRNPNVEVSDWFNCFLNECHGSGVMSLFWLFYHIKKHQINNIVIDNIDGFLHYLSMQQLGRIFKPVCDYKIIFLMNQDTLFTNYLMDLEDLYLLFRDDIVNVKQCTSRELKITHNLQTMLRAGEFQYIK